MSGIVSIKTNRHCDLLIDTMPLCPDECEGASMTGAEFQTRLDEAFFFNGANYGRVHLVHSLQEDYGLAIAQFGGHLALSDGFKAVFLEAIELMNSHCRPRVTSPLSEYFPQLVPRLVHAFHTLCGAECSANRGYPAPAFTTLRNVFDDAVLTSAALQKITNFYSIEGIDPSKPLDVIATKKARKSEEHRVRNLMTGSASGLSDDVKRELTKLNDLFDFEVHGGRLSLAGSLDFMRGTGTLPVLPKFEAPRFALFMNRFTEVSWAVHRLLPALQPPQAPMPSGWAERWTLVDESFEIAVRSLSGDLGKPVGDAYAEFMKAKFPFNASSVFPL